jgi:hypothetical protein
MRHLYEGMKNHRYSSHLQVIECPNKRTSLLKKSTDEFLRIHTSMFFCQITANRHHMREISDAFLPLKTLP